MYNKRLFRSEADKMLGGVIGGLGEFFAIDPNLLRLVFVFLTIATGVLPGIIFYLLAIIIVPKFPQTAAKEGKK